MTATNNKLVTRFPNGFTNIGPNKPLSQMPQPDPTKCHIFFDDFNKYVAGDWTVTETNAAATEALTAGNGGQLLITNTAAANDFVFLLGLKNSMVLSRTKRHWFECRVKPNSIATNNFTFGIGGTNIDIVLNMASAYGSGTQLNMYLTNNAYTNYIEIRNMTASIVDNTFMKLGWYYDGANGFYIFKDDLLVFSFDITQLVDGSRGVTFTGATTFDNFPSDTVGGTLEATIKNVSGGGTSTLTIDYLMAAVER